MNKDLNILFQYAMKPIMESEAKTYKRFLTQEEFKKNRGKIWNITGAMRNIENELKLKIEKKKLIYK
jgi:hypothetical protein